MFRRFLPLIIVILSVLIDVSVLPTFVHSYLTPIFSLCSAIALGLLLGRTQGTLNGLIAGMLMDILVGQPIGFMMMLYLSCGYLSGIAGRKFQRYLLTPVITPLICLFIFEIVLMGYQFLRGVNITGILLVQAGTRIVVEVVLVQILYLFYNKLIKPRWSRFAAR